MNRELALTLENDTPSIFIGLNPKGNEFFDFQFIENRSDELHDEYNKEKSRHSGLEANAPSLYTGNEAYYIEINTLQDLKSLCDWYDLNLDLMLDEKLKEDKQMLNKNNDVTFIDIDKIMLSKYNNWQEKHLVNLFSNDINRLATFQ